MNLAFVKDLEQLDLFCRVGLNSKDSVLVPLTPKAALAMVDMGISDTRLPIDLIEKREREEIFSQAIELSKSLHRGILPSIEYKGVDLIECCRLQMLGFFQDVLAAEKICPELIKRYHPRRANFLKYPNKASYGQTMHDGTSDVFEAVLQWRLRKAGVDVVLPYREILMGYKSRFRHSIAATIAGFSGVYAKSLGKLRNEKTPDSGLADNSSRRINLSSLPRDRLLLTGYGTDYDLLVMWPYLKALSKEIDGFPVMLNRGTNFNPSTLRSGLSLHEGFSFIIANEMGLSEDSLNFDKVISKAYSLFESNNALTAILRNPLLSFQFDYFFRLLRGAYSAARRASWFFKNYPTALFMEDWTAGAENRVWAQAANAAGVCTVSISHGAVNLVEFFDFTTKWAFSYGELARENWIFTRPEKKADVVVSGDPLVEGLQIKSPVRTQNDRNVVLLLTGGFLQQAWTDMDLQAFIKTWEKIALFAGQRPLVRFVVKPHPGPLDFSAWYSRFTKRKAMPNMIVIENQKVEELLPSAFLAVLVGKPGTAGVVAASQEVPFVYLDTMLCRDVHGYKCWRDENGVPRLTSPDQLLMLIDQLLSNSSERTRLLEANLHFLNLYMHPFQPGKICEKIGLSKSSQGGL